MQSALAVNYQTIIKILCDIRPPEPVDATYLYAQTKDNEESVFWAARKVMDHLPCRRIIILNREPGAGYTGFDVWKDRLLALGIKEDQIIGVKLKTGNHNTLTEAEAVVRFVKCNNYQTMITSAAPFHHIRAFMTTVRVAIAEYPRLKIYSIPGKTLAWNESVTHSQGTLTAQRDELINREMERIERYIDKGDLASFNEVAHYLHRRDNRDSYI